MLGIQQVMESKLCSEEAPVKNVFVLTGAGMENVGMLKCVLTFHPVQTGYASVLCKLTFFQQRRFFDWN